MRCRQSVSTALLLAAAVGNLAALHMGNQPEALHPAVEHNRTIVLTYLQAALESGRMSAVLYYRGVCRGQPMERVSFPPINVNKPLARERGLHAVREVFRSSKNVLVSETQPGVIKIRIGAVPDEILQANISRLTLRPAQQYDATSALYGLVNAADMRAAMRKERFRAVPIYPPLVNLFKVPGTDAPHLPSVMKDVTVDDVLQSVAKTFRGVVLLGACEAPRVFSIEMVPNAGTRTGSGGR